MNMIENMYEIVELLVNSTIESMLEFGIEDFRLGHQDFQVRNAVCKTKGKPVPKIETFIHNYVESSQIYDDLCDNLENGDITRDIFDELYENSMDIIKIRMYPMLNGRSRM